ncbi:hypothetical protein ASD59_01510 [Brevundimonas sp. Root608]|nr:hypothetical protein ASD59_01510 [Brevundimonas sp. Root608]
MLQRPFARNLDHRAVLGSQLFNHARFMLEAFCSDQGDGVIGALRRFDALEPKSGLVTASLKGVEARGGE